MIDPKLKVLQMVDRYGGVTAAAEAMRYTPSAVSYQLRQLAEQLGVQLIEPSGRGIQLTAAARILLRHTAVLQAQWEQARSELAANAEEPSGSFTLCGFSTAATHLLPPAAAALRDHNPRLGIRLIEAEPVRCFELLLAGEADLGLVVVTPDSPPLNDARFDQQPLLDDPLDLVVQADHPLTARRRVSLADAAREPWILGTPGSTYHQLVITACMAAGFTPDMAHQADEWETGQAMVAQGLGVILVPRLARIDTEWPVTRIRLSGEPAPARRILVATRKGAAQHPVVAQALGFLRTTAAELLPAGHP
ncbi:LysR family transcriptional regulator [Streptomyces sp. Ru73]|uniref:LysR family transcriptional regulator n=1 Tax=Streptomyces sp. Ru73 TaxID=2080748 RepID=UPI000CDCE41F|nr:LysR family transcriptional regulator [Streptomyces sp. Ru73]POX36754.1 LysR family transcriptional regulator [Streptomyces sp. Ru73]